MFLYLLVDIRFLVGQHVSNRFLFGDVGFYFTLFLFRVASPARINLPRDN